MFESAVFYAFAAVLLVSATLVITSRNPVHSALFLVLAFFTAAGTWLLLRAEFLAIALVVVYVGAVMVLFLFVVMMLDINIERLREGFWRNLPLALVVGGVLVFEMIAVLANRIYGARPRELPPGYSNTKELGRPVHRLCLCLRDRRGDPAGGDHRGDRPDPAPAQGPPLPGPVAAGRSPARGAREAGFHARRERMTVTLSHYLVLGALLFAVSVVGIFMNRRNIIILLMALELMLLAVNLNFVAFSHFLGDVAGQVFVFFILTVAAAESAIGLAILVVLFRNLNTIDVEDLDSLKG